MRALAGEAMVVIGFIHSAVGIWFGLPTVRAIVNDGFVNAIEPDPRRMA
jgi:hypothetical protein